MSENNSILKDKSFSFAISVVRPYKFLTEEKKEFVMSKQLLRSGTSVGANIREAKNAESTMDFIHKLGIAQKECDETIYWLELLKETDYIENGKFIIHNDEANQILKMIKSTILTLKQKNLKSHNS
jgi:four helix bundle protein